MEWIAVPILAVMDCFYALHRNYGVAIILLTIITKVLFFPLTIKSMTSMKAMQALQPQINALRSKYKSDPQRLQRETMELYRANKVNPLGGCLPMVVQIPIFYALYVALSVSVEMQNAAVHLLRVAIFGGRPLDLRSGGTRSDVHPSAADGRLDVRPAEDDAGDGRPTAGEDDAVHADRVHLHVPESPVGTGAVLDPLERAPDRAAEVHGTNHEPAREEGAAPEEGVTPSGAFRASDTIVGIATPPGTGALGVLRVSGSSAISIVSQLVKPSPGSLESCKPRVLYRTPVVDPLSGEQLDIALVAVMTGPASYTGEDVVELSCHGNPVVLEAIVSLIVLGGGRLAQPGEFTRRAYLHGRLDLVQVEAVAELIGARTERAARLAARQLGGDLSGEIGRCREELLDLVASLEVALDFPEDEVGLGRSEATRRAHDLGRTLERLVSNVRQGRAVQDGLSVMLAGAPNVGKSSLLNYLLGIERAIVSPMPGTTRDLVEGTLVIEGVPVRVVDGAGLGAPLDSIDAEGMRRAKQALASADLVLVILDRSRATSVHDRELLDDTAERDRLVVLNKSDLPVACDEGIESHCVCSALTGEGLPELSERLKRWVRERTASDGEERGIVASLRVLEGLRTVRLATSQAAHALALGAPYEAALVDLRDGQLAIEQILGIGHDEAILDRIFASFCVGK